MGQFQVPRWAFVSIVVTVSVTLGRLFLNSLAGYALARLDFPFRRVVFALVVATLAIPGIVLAIPRFLVIGQLGMLNTWGGLILPLAVDAFGIFLMKQFFESIPREMKEASVLTTIPVAIIFFTFQRYFVQGVAASGVKG
jgi:multiple sugar transport system permease protein